jgi:hypothetical protein
MKPTLHFRYDAEQLQFCKTTWETTVNISTRNNNNSPEQRRPIHFQNAKYLRPDVWLASQSFPCIVLILPFYNSWPIRFCRASCVSFSYFCRYSSRTLRRASKHGALGQFDAFFAFVKFSLQVWQWDPALSLAPAGESPLHTSSLRVSFEPSPILLSSQVIFAGGI